MSEGERSLEAAVFSCQFSVRGFHLSLQLLAGLRLFFSSAGDIPPATDLVISMTYGGGLLLRC